MIKFKKVSVLILAFIIFVSLTACADKGEKMHEWFNTRLASAYSSYVNSADGQNAVAPDVAALVASEQYINAVFSYISDGTQPQKAEIKEENGAYVYEAELFKQVIRVDSEKPAVEVTMVQEYMGERRTDFITVIAEKNGEYFVQQLLPDFGEYYEIRFTVNGGSTKTITDCYELPYSIFDNSTPENFAKES